MKRQESVAGSLKIIKIAQNNEVNMIDNLKKVFGAFYFCQQRQYFETKGYQWSEMVIDCEDDNYLYKCYTKMRKGDAHAILCDRVTITKDKFVYYCGKPIARILLFSKKN